MIGKHADMDGVIKFNNAVSRRHCMIEAAEGRFTITDLQSANGTFVNKQRLSSGTPAAIGEGDVIRLANTDFKVSIE